MSDVALADATSEVQAQQHALHAVVKLSRAQHDTLQHKYSTLQPAWYSTQ